MRRMKFGARAGVCLVLLATMFTAGCSAAWLTTFESYLKIAAPSLISILDLIALATGHPVNAALVAKINADGAALTSAADSVAKAGASNTQGACQQFNLAIATFAANLTAIEQVGQVSSPATQAQIAALTQLAQQTISEIEAPIASCAASTQPVAHMAMARSAAGLTKPAEYTVKFNSILDRNTGDVAVVGKTKPLHIHVHSKLARYATAGLLK